MTDLKTIDGETLMSQPLQPLNFVVDTLISQGLHILAGSPKVGKSWLALCWQRPSPRVNLSERWG